MVYLCNNLLFLWYCNSDIILPWKAANTVVLTDYLYGHVGIVSRRRQQRSASVYCSDDTVYYSNATVYWSDVTVYCSDITVYCTDFTNYRTCSRVPRNILYRLNIIYSTLSCIHHYIILVIIILIGIYTHRYNLCPSL